jgi:hypothetical protein
MLDLVIEIRGGVLVGIYRSGNNIPIAVVDWDDAQYGSHVSFTKPMQMSEIPIETRQAITTLGKDITDHDIAK